ncbi:MAG TPA: hypothetical protein VFE61_18895 [Candidatus Sulfotelmatobacter sp.]|nr:hypothetical protein [Candidatus Sulfotelmatobacter sp.]
MCLKSLCVAVLLLSVTGVCAAGNYVVPTTTLAAQTVNNTSAANTFDSQTNGNFGAGNVSKVDVHSLLYPGANTKIYAHLLLWFGGSNHMNVGYSSTDPKQIHRQITDMISRGIDGVIIDWYGPNNSIDQATKLVMAEAETHPGFTFAIMVDQGAIQWDSCKGCSPQQALISQLQYVEQTYFPSPAYMTHQGRPVITNFNIDLSYKIDWKTVNAALATQPLFLFQNNDGFSHVLTGGSYSWVMPTTTDYGMNYLHSFYDTGMPRVQEQTVGASYKGFNDILASWGSKRIMGQQCGQTWLRTFSEINGLYNSGNQLSALQLVTWNDYEEGTEIESGVNNCVSITAAVSGNSLKWTVKGTAGTVDHYVVYISTDGQHLMPLADANAETASMKLCSYSIPNGNYVLYVKAVGKPSIVNQVSGPIKFTSTCGGSSAGANLTFGTSPSSMTIASGGSGRVTVTATPVSGSFNDTISLDCPGLPQSLNCSFAPASITPGGNAVSSILTISAGSVGAMNYRRNKSNPISLTWLFSLGVIGFAVMSKVERKRLFPAVGACAVVAVMVGSSACAGGTSRTSTTVNVPSAYAVTINGSSGSIQLSTTVAVTLQ